MMGVNSGSSSLSFVWRGEDVGASEWLGGRTSLSHLRWLLRVD